MLWPRHRAPESPSWPRFLGADPLQIPIDSNGNLSTKTEGTDTWTYTWNAQNRLTKVEKNGAEQARFAYDPLGRRVEKVAGGVTISYTYDNEDILREVRGSTTLKYVHGLEIDEPLAVDDGTALSYYHFDGLGSVVKTTNGAGAVTLTRQYDAWGSLETGANEAGYAFTGREWDPETGIYYYRARYYDPKLGRFISEDPIGLSDGPNKYAYVQGNPVGRLDPYGLQASPPSTPTPTPTPSPEPINHRPRHELPQPYNLCDFGEIVVFWDFAPVNPNVQQGRYIRWKNAFITECYKAEKFQPGRDYRARVAPINPNMVAQSDWPSTAIGVCCEKCKE